MRENTKVKISVLACKNCGEPMYPDMKSGGFRCLYCYEMDCPSCGKHLKSMVVDGIFTCPYCNQKFGERERIANGKFDERLVVGRKLNLYSKCLPFAVSRAVAMRKIEDMAKRFAEDLCKVELEASDLGSYAEKRLDAAYVPVQLADFRWKVQAECERGTFYYYQECLENRLADQHGWGGIHPYPGAGGKAFPVAGVHDAFPAHPSTLYKISLPA